MGYPRVQDSSGITLQFVDIWENKWDDVFEKKEGIQKHKDKRHPSQQIIRIDTLIKGSPNIRKL